MSDQHDDHPPFRIIGDVEQLKQRRSLLNSGPSPSGEGTINASGAAHHPPANHHDPVPAAPVPDEPSLTESSLLAVVFDQCRALGLQFDLQRLAGEPFGEVQRDQTLRLWRIVQCAETPDAASWAPPFLEVTTFPQAEALLSSWATWASKAAPATDESGWVPMSDVWHEHFESASACTRFLDSHTVEIRTRKRAKNRREVYLPDWHRHWKRQEQIQAEALDTDEMNARLADIDARKAQEAQRRKSSRS
jgi:hypothetical protein